MKVYFANQVEKFQKFNFILAGMNLNGYLPPEKVIKYRTIEYSDYADINFNLHVNSGSMELYGLVCEKFSECLIKGKNIKNFSNLISFKFNKLKNRTKSN